MKYLTNWKAKHMSQPDWQYVVIVTKNYEESFKFLNYEEAEAYADDLVYAGVGLNNVNIVTWEDYNAN